MSEVTSVAARKTVFLSLLVVAGGAFAAGESAFGDDDWPSFRGPEALNVAAEDPRLPITWSQTENVAWVQEVPGQGWSSPIVLDGKIYLTTVWTEGELEEPKKGLYYGGNRAKPPEGTHHWTVYCFDLESGKKCWEREVHSGAPEFPRHIKNSYASETPVTDGERVYAYFGNLGIYAISIDGDLVWKKELEPSRTRFGWGTAASPVLHAGRLYVVNDNDDQSFLMALDAATGEEVWRVDRDERSNWATPFVWENELRTEIVTSGSGQVRSYDLDGNLLWHFGGMSSITIPQPFAAHGLLYLASGYVGDQRRPVFAIRPGGEGDIGLPSDEDGGYTAESNEYVAWFHPQAAPYNPTPLVYGGIYYTLFDRGFFTAHDAKTGDEIYGKQRLERGAGGFTASPWAYNGKIFALNEDGDTFVIEAGERFEVVGKNSLDEMCMATPAIAEGGLVLRTRSKLYRITDVETVGDDGR